MEIKKVGVAGCGLMGHGITQVSAQAGYDVVVTESSQDKLDAGIAKITKQLGRAVDKGKMEQSAADEILGRINPTLDLNDFADCDLVIEAITEDLDLKLELWKQLDDVVKDEAYFATNTSSLPVINQAAATTRPTQFLGLHFFNPVQVMPLLEVIQSVTTSPEAMGVGLAYGAQLKKQTVETKDKAGFIVNRLLVPYMLDAIRGLEEGIGSIDEIDAAMKAGAGHPMGPLALCDFVGLDTLMSISNVLFDEFRERRFAAPPTLRKMVAAGFYGTKTGRGFYDYSGDKPVSVNPGL
ncbi:MAG: 3-hydroxybutyryl-CoA dehydrogenase [Solirubrobacterales bacterium]